MPFTTKVPIKDVIKPNIMEIVNETLSSDNKNAYTIMGIMLERFGFKEKDIRNKPFSQWPKGAPTIYTKIRHALNKLEKKGMIKSAKYGKARVYWSVNLSINKRK